MPPTVATVMGTACALWQGNPAAGTTMVSDVGVAATTVAITPAIATSLDAGPRKPVPAIVAVVPGASEAGTTEVMVGATEPSGATTTIPSVPETLSVVAVSVVAPGLFATSCPRLST